MSDINFREMRKARLLDQLGKVDANLTTKFLARTCGLDQRMALKLLCELQAEGRAVSTYDQLYGRCHRVWSLRSGALA